MNIAGYPNLFGCAGHNITIKELAVPAKLIQKVRLGIFYSLVRLVKEEDGNELKWHRDVNALFQVEQKECNVEYNAKNADTA